jgi:lipoprotein-anchoring transpeptidase ErfK/SrfK
MKARPARTSSARTRSTGAGGATARTGPAGRLGLTATVAVLVALTAIVIAVFSVRSGGSGGPALADQARSPRPAPAKPAVAYSAPGPAVAAGQAEARSLPAGGSVPGSVENPGAVSLALTAADHHDCPAAAAACVDLARHITWMQAGGKVTFGPVQMEPGNPAGKHRTPRGTFRVSWKAGPAFMSSEYHEPMPWATFFAAGGIAFHGGPLGSWSHGCVHLTAGNAHFYNAHLPIGAEVEVF